MLSRLLRRKRRPIVFFGTRPQGAIELYQVRGFAQSVARNWEEAKRQLYDGTFARLLRNGGREDWARHAGTIVESQADQDIGLFTFAIKISLSAQRHVNTFNMLDVAKAATEVIPPISGNRRRIEQLLAQVPKSVTVYYEEERSEGFYYTRRNEAYDFLDSLLRDIERLPRGRL